jgi:hypothetical protein
MNEDGLIDIQELAAKMKLGTKWIRHAVKFDGLPCIRFNSRTWRFHWPTVLAWLSGR